MSELDFVDGVTPLNDANLSTLLSKNPVRAAGANILASKLVSSDAQPAFRIMGDGKHEWGPGGASAPDTNLYRSAVDTLQTDDALTSAAPSGNFTALLPDAVSDRSPFRLLIAGETQPRMRVNQLGTLNWGPGGSTAPDVNLYRYAANPNVATDKAFWSRASGAGNAAFVASELAAASPALLVGQASQDWKFKIESDGKMHWAPLNGGFDVNLYRSGVDNLKTDDQFNAAGNIVAGAAIYGLNGNHICMYGPSIAHWKMQSGRVNLSTDGSGVGWLFYGTTFTSVLGVVVMVADPTNFGNCWCVVGQVNNDACLIYVRKPGAEGSNPGATTVPISFMVIGSV